MNLNTPLTLHRGCVLDAGGEDLHTNLTGPFAEELIRRANLHDELVKALEPFGLIGTHSTDKDHESVRHYFSVRAIRQARAVLARAKEETK